MFKCVLLKVPFINIQIFRTFRESGYVNTICMFYIQIHMYKLYQLYVEMQAHIRLHSITTLYEIKATN